MYLRALAAIAALLLVSCGSARLSAPVISTYRMEIQQGNFVSQEMVSQLKLGMTKEQVRFVLGTPLITDSFHADRWDYVFRRQKSNSRELEQYKLAVFFEEGKLARVDSEVTPAVKTPEAMLEAPAAKSQAQPQPASSAAPISKPEAQSAAEVPKPAPAVAPEKSDQTPVPPGAAQPQEKKGWWDRIKDAVKF